MSAPRVASAIDAAAVAAARRDGAVAHGDDEPQLGGFLGRFLAHVDVGDIGFRAGQCRGNLCQHALAVAHQHADFGFEAAPIGQLSAVELPEQPGGDQVLLLQVHVGVHGPLLT